MRVFICRSYTPSDLKASSRLALMENVVRHLCAIIIFHTHPQTVKPASSDWSQEVARLWIKSIAPRTN